MYNNHYYLSSNFKPALTLKDQMGLWKLDPTSITLPALGRLQIVQVRASASAWLHTGRPSSEKCKWFAFGWERQRLRLKRLAFQLAARRPHVLVRRREGRWQKLDRIHGQQEAHVLLRRQKRRGQRRRSWSHGRDGHREGDRHVARTRDDSHQTRHQASQFSTHTSNIKKSILSNKHSLIYLMLYI